MFMISKSVREFKIFMNFKKCSLTSKNVHMFNLFFTNIKNYFVNSTKIFISFGDVNKF